MDDCFMDEILDDDSWMYEYNEIEDHIKLIGEQDE